MHRSFCLRSTNNSKYHLISKKNHNCVTIKQLFQTDHSKFLTKTYTCVAKIRKFNCTEGWY
ncbi:hypothetical protein SCA6_014125 [Theobroma cacao]